MPYMRVSNSRLYYTICGGGPPILFLAGLSLDTGSWDTLDGYLENDYTLVKVDCRGSGKSDVPRGPYSIEEMAAEIGYLGSGLGIENAVVVALQLLDFDRIMLNDFHRFAADRLNNSGTDLSFDDLVIEWESMRNRSVRGESKGPTRI